MSASSIMAAAVRHGSRPANAVYSATVKSLPPEVREGLTRRHKRAIRTGVGLGIIATGTVLTHFHLAWVHPLVSETIAVAIQCIGAVPFCNAFLFLPFMRE